jgi:hypothetical protein
MRLCAYFFHSQRAIEHHFLAVSRGRAVTCAASPDLFAKAMPSLAIAFKTLKTFMPE